MSDARVRLGSCLCGAVRYRLTTAPLGINVCHCRRCRKASGTAFATNAAVPREGFTLLEGQEHLAHHTSSPGKHRHFCGCCGSPIYSSYDARPEVVYLRVGTLDDDEGLAPDAHIHADSGAPWYRIRDAVPQLDEQDLWF